MKNMTKWLFPALLFSSLPLRAEESAFSKAPPLETVESVEIGRYLGKWFEIARLPQIFQPGCTSVTAEYSQNDDGSVKVVNFCRILDPVNGVPISITGTAKPIDASNSKLEVQFFAGGIPGKYWILELDENYQWALVGDPSRQSLYLLSRSPELATEIYDELRRLAVEKHGYNIDRLIKTKQNVE